MKLKFSGKQIAFFSVFLSSSIVAEISLALHWPGWIVWALLPLIIFSALMFLIPVLESVKKYDEAARSGRSLGGTRFSRVLDFSSELMPTVTVWAEKYGYKVHPLSTPTKALYFRTPFAMMPIFVMIQNLESTIKIEAWIVVQTGKEEGLTSGASIRIPNWIGVSDVNKLLAELKQPPVEKLKLPKLSKSPPTA